jgi:hypothetical protein
VRQRSHAVAPVLSPSGKNTLTAFVVNSRRSILSSRLVASYSAQHREPRRNRTITQLRGTSSDVQIGAVLARAARPCQVRGAIRPARCGSSKNAPQAVRSADPPPLAVNSGELRWAHRSLGEGGPQSRFSARRPRRPDRDVAPPHQTRGEARGLLRASRLPTASTASSSSSWSRPRSPSIPAA